MSCPAGYTFDINSKKTPLATATETFRPGERFRYWGYESTWTENHIPASRLESLRMMGDRLADDAMNALNVKPNQDAYMALVSY
ncbi:hypothetical protein BGX26_004014, partial [Mortierella sp. AD094]